MVDVRSIQILSLHAAVLQNFQDNSYHRPGGLRFRPNFMTAAENKQATPKKIYISKNLV